MIGSVVMTRPSVSGWCGTVKPYCDYHLLPMRPAKRSPRGSVRYRWCAIAATTTRCRPHTDIARSWFAVMGIAAERGKTIHRRRESAASLARQGVCHFQRFEAVNYLHRRRLDEKGQENRAKKPV